jgi:hypothetical protein
VGTLSTIVTLVSDTLRGERLLWVALAPGGLVLLVALWAWRWLRNHRRDADAERRSTAATPPSPTPSRAGAGAARAICSSTDLSLFVENRRRRGA